MIYNYIRDIENKNLLRYAAVIAFVVFFVVRIVKPKFIHVVGLLAALALVYYLNDKNIQTIGDENKDLEYQLNTLRPKPEYFHYDANLVKFFYDIREFRKYNKPAYDNALIGTDHILKIKGDMEIGVDICEHHLDIAREFMNKVMNNMHSMIYQTPGNKITMDKYQRSLKALHILLRRHIDDMFKMCYKQRDKQGTNIYTTIRYNDDIKENDTDRLDYNPSYNMYHIW